MDASDQMVPRACVVWGWASQELRRRMAPPSGNSGEHHELLTLPDLQADPCNFTAAHKTGVTPLEVLYINKSHKKTISFLWLRVAGSIGTADLLST